MLNRLSLAAVVIGALFTSATSARAQTPCAIYADLYTSVPANYFQSLTPMARLDLLNPSAPNYQQSKQDLYLATTYGDLAAQYAHAANLYSAAGYNEFARNCGLFAAQYGTSAYLYYYSVYTDTGNSGYYNFFLYTYYGSQFSAGVYFGY